MTWPLTALCFCHACRSTPFSGVAVMLSTLQQLAAFTSAHKLDLLQT